MGNDQRVDTRLVRRRHQRPVLREAHGRDARKSLDARQTTGLFFNNPGAEDGYVLFSPNTTTSTYLMDKSGNIVNQWNTDYEPGLISYLSA